jgi:hypothetical protein
MKDIIYHTVRTVSNSNRKIVGKIDTPNMHIHDHSLSGLVQAPQKNWQGYTVLVL